MTEISTLQAVSLYFCIFYCIALHSAVLTPSHKYCRLQQSLYYKKILHIKSIFIFLLLLFSLFVKNLHHVPG